LSSVRAVLREALPPEAVTEVVDALQREHTRLERAARGVELVRAALGGARYRPRL
jgi:hypothetical protein